MRDRYEQERRDDPNGFDPESGSGGGYPYPAGVKRMSAEREIWNSETGQYEFANDGRVDTPYTPPEEPYTGMDMSAEQIAAYNAANPLPAGQRWTWDRFNWVVVGTPEETPTPPVLPNPNAADADERYRIAWNGGSPPAIQLKPNHGWEFDPNAVAWKQVEGRGIGWSATTGGPPPPAPGGSRPPGPTIASGPARLPSVGAASGAVAGVPSSYGQASAVQQAILPMPSLASAMESAKALPQLRQTAFQAPPIVGLEGRNRIVESILANPDVMGQTQQDQLFEQQKEQQASLAAQARQRLGQMTTSRGLSAVGGTELMGQAGIEEGFINALLAGRRDIATQAAQANRASQQDAIRMADAVQQGDFARAQTAYGFEQENAQALYNAQRANIALAAQSEMAAREQAVQEQQLSFQQYMDQLRYNELLRQFNENMAFDYGKFGWEQQRDFLNAFSG